MKVHMTYCSLSFSSHSYYLDNTLHAQIILSTTAGAVALGNAFYGPGTGDIYLSNLACRGNESNLIECPGLGPDTFCFHFEDAGVRCSAPPCTSPPYY